MKFARQSNLSVVLATVLLIAQPVMAQSGQQSGRSVPANRTPMTGQPLPRSDGGGQTNSSTIGKQSTGIATPATSLLPSANSENSSLNLKLDWQKPTQNSKVTIRDIALNAAGNTTLTVLKTSGQPLAGQTVTLKVGASRIAQATTNVKGQVQVTGLKPGLHVVQTGLTQTMVRFWPAGLAPPQAIKNPAIVDTSDLVRGQYGYGPPMGAGLFAATVTAAGVAVAIVGKTSGSDNAAAVVPASP